MVATIMSTPSSSFVFAFLLTLILCALAPRLAVSQICYPCLVTACGGQYNATNITVQLPANTSVDGAASCASLSSDLSMFIASALNSPCQMQIAQFACSALILANQTETACNVSTIGQNTSYATNNTFFTTTCQSEVACLGYALESELIAANACASFSNFFSAVIAAQTPSTISCTTCNISACYNTSAYTGFPNPTVSFAAGSLPGIAGNACPAMNAVATALVSNPASPQTLPQAIASTCGSLAALGQIPNQIAECNAGLEETLFDGIIFAAAAQQNLTWQTDCPLSIPAIFSPAVANSLIAAGYCVSPHSGLVTYGNQLLANSSNSASSSGSARISSSSSSSAATNNGSVISSTGNTGATTHAAINAFVIAATAAAVAVLLLC